MTQEESANTISVRRQLLDSFRDQEYRTEFVSERVRSSVALQIRALRQARSLTQANLGEAIGMAQTWVSKLENPDYGKMTVATLLRLAKAFDTDLEIKFRPFSTTIRDLTTQGSGYFDVPSFEEEFGQDDLSPDELASDISRARLFISTPCESIGVREVLRSAGGAAAAQMRSVKEVARMPPGMALAPTAEERLYASH